MSAFSGIWSKRAEEGRGSGNELHCHWCSRLQREPSRLKDGPRNNLFHQIDNLQPRKNSSHRKKEKRGESKDEDCGDVDKSMMNGKSQGYGPVADQGS